MHRISESILIDFAHSAGANEAELLRVVGGKLAVGSIECAGDHVPEALKGVPATDAGPLEAGPLVPLYRCQLHHHNLLRLCTAA